MSYNRYKCPNCKSIKVVLFEYNDIECDNIWRAELKCGKCGKPIYEWGR